MSSTKELLSGMLFFQFFIFVMCSVLAIGSMEQSLHDFSYEFLGCSYLLILELTLIYPLCHFATNLTNESTDIADKTYNTLWYLLPLEQQKMISPIIRQGQIPFVLDGFKIFSCSMETFSKVKYSIINLGKWNWRAVS